MSVHSRRARAALEALVETDPAIAALSLWCVHRDGEETGTIGTTITYGADFAERPGHEQQSVAAHHVLHVALRHSARMADMAHRLGDAFDAARWNLAADALVNEAVTLAGHALPRPTPTLSVVLAEAGIEGTLADWDVERLYHALAGTGAGEGDAARGFVRDLAPEAGDAADASEDAARWRQHLSRALDTGRRTGRGLGRVGHLIADIPSPQTPWEVVLRGLLARAATPIPRPAPMRPSRRWLAVAAQAERAGTFVPGFEAGQRPTSDIPRIAVALDASGSVDDARLALFWAEVTGIARRLRAELHLLVFDEAIRHHARIEPGVAPRLPPMPREGGTSFAPVIEAARGLSAAALVVLTDLDGDAGSPPPFPVIWAVPDPNGATAPYGRVLDLSH
ncbi:vWA domain-containing protein [Jannaschia aquimarina]|uniref:Metal-dependent peptidase n=1 Tax=Jannaschia aquimarina TaxID=935700 RepID=A0A0D1D4N3_9RHOB|nr:VWA-like domain-containing protein [Jannaschia aquimarina]KIT15033.1 hypothetical protein jaqu_33590 [Jannaschia aquimarina]SNS62400.1 Predicted metal-dependent peptidase [Jannaschia aquimarina]